MFRSKTNSQQQSCLEMGITMAEQNILAGGAAVLEQVISDIREHNEKKERLDKLADTKRDLCRNLESAEKEIKDEIESKIKSAVESICAGYNKSIDADRLKLKEVQGQRDKAKVAGVKERIGKETQQLHKENADLKSQVREAFNLEGIPMYCNSRLFFALFQTRDVFDFVIYILFLIALYAAIPFALSLIPGVPEYALIIYYFIVAVINISAMKIIYNRTLVKHSKTISDARATHRKMVDNKKRIKRIARGIRKDKNEDMYGLESFDYSINELHDHIRKIEEDKAKALDEFEKTAKPDIVSEVEGRNKNRITIMKSEIAKKEEEMLKLDTLIKEQRIYISSNYEAYLGKEFMNLDKLQELYSYMKSGIADTVSQALAVYKDRH